MKYLIIITTLISLSINAQVLNSSKFKICSKLSQSDILDRLSLDDNGIGKLASIDDMNGGLKFKLKGSEDIINSVKKIPGAMRLKRVKNMIEVFESPQQFFEMTESKVVRSYKKDGKDHASLWVVVRPLPRHISPKPGQSHLKYYAKYMLNCSLQDSPIRLKCRRDKRYNKKNSASFLMDEVNFDISVKRDDSCSGNQIIVNHSTLINKNDYNSLLKFITKELLGVSIPSSLMGFFVKPEDMSDDMMDDYMIKLYKNWTKN